ncbi:hypothetical protein HHI36_006374 [Cryptolaemus montrouzieri]|uniref:Uncharacterized protein n=1 Tax=Cryptolaemus montrouzieri TaxID=559131 RepID=A0ABD2NXY8_9CUCU
MAGESIRKFFFILVSCTAALGAPLIDDASATIIDYKYELQENGYTFEYVTSNGISRSETGRFIKDLSGNEILKVDGFYSYEDDTGKLQRVQYHADENGFIPQTSFMSVRPSPALGIPPPIAPASAAGYAGGLGGTIYSEKQEPKGISSAALASLGG